MAPMATAMLTVYQCLDDSVVYLMVDQEREGEGAGEKILGDW